MEFFIVFLIGFLGYPLLEILWRGYTHIAMAFAGGICFFIIYFLSKRLVGISIFEKALWGALAITIVELLFGFIFNIVLNMNIWDYSYVPFNFYGQICLRYFLIWTALCFGLFPLCGFLAKIL